MVSKTIVRKGVWVRVPLWLLPKAKRRNMMQFTKVDDDAYTVLVNLDTIRRIGGAFLDQENEGMGDERDAVLGASFSNAHERLSKPETSEEVVETSDEQ
jgi:hypothetical protein